MGHRTLKTIENATESYKVVMYWSADDGFYIAQVPDLAGCMADGATREEALHNVEVVMGEWLEVAEQEGRPLPQGQMVGECPAEGGEHRTTEYA